MNDDTLTSLNIKTVENINENKTNLVKDSNKTFDYYLNNAENNLKCIVKNSNHYKNLDGLKRIIDENIYVSSFFKYKKFESFINNDFKQNYNYYNEIMRKLCQQNKIRENIVNNTKYNINNSNYKEKTFPRQISENSINFNTINNTFNNNFNYNTINNTNNRTNDFNMYDAKETYTKKSNDGGKIIYNNINCNSFIVKYPSTEEENNTGDLFNTASNDKNNRFIGIKRNSEELNRHKTEIDNIYNEIKDLYNRYKRNNLKNSENIIYEHKKGIFEKNETIILENKAVCTIYFKKDIIESIFLISEEKKVKQNNEIIEVLSKIRQDLIDLNEKKLYMIEE